MSRKKFMMLALFMIFTFIIAVSFTIFEVNSHFSNKKDVTIVLENTRESQAEQEQIAQLEEQTPITKESEIAKENKISESSEISLVFTGDVLLTDSLIQLYNNNADEITGIISSDIIKELIEGDITMINQEFPFSTGGIKMVDKQYTFRMDPKYVKLLGQMGVDIVSLANNHTLDFGSEALLDTIFTLDKAQIKHVGGGENLEKAKTTEYIKIDEKTVAFLGASRVIPVHSWNAGKDSAGLFTTYDPTMLLEEIKTAKEKSDYVVVYVHWGIEKKEYPENYQRELAKQYIDGGADIIIGSHPHVLQGIEFYKEKPIVYSMGNFVFGSSSFQTMLLKIKIDAKGMTEMQIVPCEAKAGVTASITNTDKKIQFYNYIESISYHTTINHQGNVLQDGIK